MLQTWRWFGPDDPVSLENAGEAGAAGIVTALHHMNQGEVWSVEEIEKRRSEIERAGLVWSVVESIGVGEEIKTRSGGFRAKIDNHKQSIRNAARAGVKVFCYNFMAITDWTRTDLNWRLPNGERPCASTRSISPLTTFSCSSAMAPRLATRRRGSPRPARVSRR